MALMYSIALNHVTGVQTLLLRQNCRQVVSRPIQIS
jgi:hypothetical protein